VALKMRELGPCWRPRGNLLGRGVARGVGGLKRMDLLERQGGAGLSAHFAGRRKCGVQEWRFIRSPIFKLFAAVDCCVLRQMRRRRRGPWEVVVVVVVLEESETV
jgi:hypothetical protein